jgi:hypothetical protein
MGDDLANFHEQLDTYIKKRTTQTIGITHEVGIMFRPKKRQRSETLICAAGKGGTPHLHSVSRFQLSAV